MLTVRPLTSGSHEDRANVLRLFLETPSYSELVEGRPPSTEDVEDFFHGKPESSDAADKRVFGFYLGPDMIGCADVIRSYPTSDCAWIGLLLFSAKHQGHGYGKVALALLDSMAREWGYLTFQLAAVSTNTRGVAFWQHDGFEEIRRAVNSRFTGELIVMERPVR